MFNVDMVDLTKPPEPDADDPKGSAEGFGKYALGFGIAGGAFALGQRFIATPVENVGEMAVTVVRNLWANTDAQNDESNLPEVY